MYLHLPANFYLSSFLLNFAVFRYLQHLWLQHMVDQVKPSALSNCRWLAHSALEERSLKVDFQPPHPIIHNLCECRQSNTFHTLISQLIVTNAYLLD
jgi:hypothetical protein